ncbi:cytochrome c oxidase assembly protein [Agrobacterium vitis]|uniref:Cytochrome c oxidase assembly protein CtaG n=1 Tax=Agrobacterium vitis TaxID=373 RepID=A0AAE5AWB3_AGRVI|nr:cytochrome c oxidase assembly protein [Agrobacterium vitis]MCF1499770.1 cytochrome c oxidase assembly protein [Allorhizobium sp. Av2]MCM2440838.1 cytochrome c oxidase assembly protein [Agrobacterium vitis]MUZ59183.1 cytochrome c oxidase assembly protein [Agrobacterium vitis]MVA66832.1 cytochrome c oxidase assembly protein [Agrobacterium vitis]MVA87275.1 cytochrome c oxidase assembly protein [Agrobacterium vitis]
MAEPGGKQAEERRGKGKDLTVFFACLAFVGGVTAMSFAAAPFYRMYCQLTGYNGTTQRAEQPSSVILDRKMTVTFDANVSPGLNWDFKPMQASVAPRIGETIQANYSVTNRSPYTTKGQAVFNVTPMEAAVYFNKIECFCFTETVLQPGQTLDMPVVFYIDPDIMAQPETKNIGTVTLSYTFYPHGGEKPVAGIAQDKATVQPKL